MIKIRLIHVFPPHESICITFFHVCVVFTFNHIHAVGRGSQKSLCGGMQKVDQDASILCFVPMLLLAIDIHNYSKAARTPCLPLKE